MPVLFSHCIIRSHHFDFKPESPVFLPQSIWPFVQQIKFGGHFSRPDLPWYSVDDFPRGDPEWELYPLRRLTIAQNLGQTIKDALSSMGALHSVVFFLPCAHPDHIWDPNAVPGISWHVLEAVLSTPHLRHVSVDGTLFHPADHLPHHLMLPELARLISFRYEDVDYRPVPRSTSMEKEALLLILGRIHASLERLVLQSDSTPLHAMHLWDWPHLREFELRGERPSFGPHCAPLVAVLGRMPRLRTLSIALSEPAGTEPLPIWPTSFHGDSFEWRDLEELTVTHPRPDDEFYAHLPSAMRRLTLRCWPRYYKHHCKFNEFMHAAGVDWGSPLPLASDILRIICRTDMPYLTCLELEYRADDDDSKLLRYIGSSFSCLAVLRVHRYRATGEKQIPVTQIAQSMKRLTQLRLLMMHLDFPELPDVTAMGGYYVQDEATWPEQARGIQRAFGTIDAAANILASNLAPSLSDICLLFPLWHQLQQWRCFRVVHREDGSRGGYAEFVDSVPIEATIFGFS
ncbi:hypothetical protein C8Q79DRAFT_904620 [Trametes meyenii]|nr:hypothetical protein C8Q79DRAFT_904620 [Trametes meyenii]